MKKINFPKNKGFVAFIAVLTISVALIVMALSTADTIVVLFDETTLKKYRIAATQSALACLDQVYIELEHDYFYNIPNMPVEYRQKQCSIVLVKSVHSENVHLPTATRSIVVKGYSGTSSSSPHSITATIAAQVLVNSQSINLVSETVQF